MEVTSKTTEELKIVTDDAEVINVTLVDESPGVGRLVVTGGGVTKACYWNGMGASNIRQFMKMASDAYIAGCLDPFGTLYRKVDPAALKVTVIADIEASDRLDDEQKLQYTARVVEFDPVSDINGLQALNNELLTGIYGPMWTQTEAAKFQGKHPQYVGLFTRLAVIRSALEA